MIRIIDIYIDGSMLGSVMCIDRFCTRDSSHWREGVSFLVEGTGNKRKNTFERNKGSHKHL